MEHLKAGEQRREMFTAAQSEEVYVHKHTHIHAPWQCLKCAPSRELLCKLSHIHVIDVFAIKIITTNVLLSWSEERPWCFVKGREKQAVD